MIYERERAARGARRMDKCGPNNWFDMVNVAMLDVQSTSNCICAQTHGGSYEAGIKAIGLTTSAAYVYGFAGRTPELEEAWREEIATRRLRALPVAEWSEVGVAGASDA